MERDVDIPEKWNPVCFPVLVSWKKKKYSVVIYPTDDNATKHTLVLNSDSWVGQRTYIPFEIKIFENLKMDLIFPGIFCTGLLKNCSTSFSGGTVTLLLIVTLGLNLSLLPFNRENGDLVQWAISRT